MFSLKQATQTYYGFTTLFTANFLIFFSGGMLNYVNSAFLGTLFSPEAVTLIFVALSLLSIASLAFIPSLLRSFGIRSVLVWLIPIAQLAILLYGLGKGTPTVLLFFLAQGIALTLLTYLMDLYIENLTKNEGETGSIRSLFLTAMNLATLLAPITIIFLVIDNYYSSLFALAAAILIPVFALSLTSFKKLEPRVPEKSSFLEAIMSLRTCRYSLARVIGAHFVLQMFFAWMVIYAPLFLLQSGYSWQVIGSVFIFALLPYLILDIPVGILADRYFGEVEMMAIGFVILAVALASLSFIPVSLIVFWAIAFFFTRVGAALVEVTTESYFFKQVNESDAALVSLFRMLRPFGLLGGSLLGLLFLPLLGFQYLFAAFGVIILFGIPLALRIRDSR